MDWTEHLTEDLLKPKYRKSNMPKTYGHCYVASEAWYHLGRKSQGYSPFHARDNENNVHWWLRDPAGNIYDPTASQYTERDLKPPYDKGRKGAFLTKEPSKRALVLMERILEDVHKGTMRSTLRGHKITWDKKNGCWKYNDTGKLIQRQEKNTRPCAKCERKYDTGNIEVDPCLGLLPGVDQACCGHGDPDDAYVRFTNGIILRGFKVEYSCGE